MAKTESTAAMTEASGFSKTDCGSALAAFITATDNALKVGDKVPLVSFGTPEVKERAAWIGRDPTAGAKMEAPFPSPLPASPARPLRTLSSKIEYNEKAPPAALLWPGEFSYVVGFIVSVTCRRTVSTGMSRSALSCSRCWSRTGHRRCRW